MTGTDKYALALIDDADFKGTSDFLGELSSLFANTTKEASTLSRATDQLMASFTGLSDGLSSDQKDALGSAALSAVRAVVQASDTYIQLKSQLRSVTSDQEELNSTFDATYRIAQETRTGLAETVEVYTNLASSADGAKMSSEQLIEVTRRLLSSSTEVAANFDKVPRTVSESLQQLSNDFIVTFGQADMSGFNEAIDDLRDVITDPAFAQSAVAVATAVADIFGVVASGASKVVDFAKYAGEEVASLINGVAADDIPRLERELSNLKDNLGLSFWDRDISLKLTGDEEIQRQVDELEKKLKVAYELQESLQTAPRAPAGGKPDEKLVPIISGVSGLASGSKVPNAIDQRIAALNMEAETYRMTASEAELYRLKAKGATEPQLESLRKAQAEIEKLKQEDKKKEEEKEREEAEKKKLTEKSVWAIDDRSAAEDAQRVGINSLDKDDGAYGQKRAALEAAYKADIGDIEAKESGTITDEFEAKLLREKEFHENRRAYLEEQREKELIGQADFDAKMEAENDRHEAAVTKTKKDEWKARLGATQNVLGQLSALTSSENRKMFEIGKAAALANGVIDAISAVMGAYKVGAGIGGPVLGAAFGAAAAVAQYSQLAQIQSTQFGGGGSPAGMGGGGGVPLAPPPSQLPGASGDSSSKSVSITINGSVVGATKDELVDMFGDALRERIDHKDYVLIDSKSRNGRALR